MQLQRKLKIVLEYVQQILIATLFAIDDWYLHSMMIFILCI